MKAPETPLFVKTHDFNVWLFNHTQRFPKRLRHTLTQRIENRALSFEEALIEANGHRGEDRLLALNRADVDLQCLRVLLRYTIDFEMVGSRQYEHASNCLNELGRLLGAWLRGTAR